MQTATTVPWSDEEVPLENGRVIVQTLVVAQRSVRQLAAKIQDAVPRGSTIFSCTRHDMARFMQPAVVRTLVELEEAGKCGMSRIASCWLKQNMRLG